MLAGRLSPLGPVIAICLSENTFDPSPFSSQGALATGSAPPEFHNERRVAHHPIFTTKAGQYRQCWCSVVPAAIGKLADGGRK